MTRILTCTKFNNLSLNPNQYSEFRIGYVVQYNIVMKKLFAAVQTIKKATDHKQLTLLLKTENMGQKHFL